MRSCFGLMFADLVFVCKLVVQQVALKTTYAFLLCVG